MKRHLTISTILLISIALLAACGGQKEAPQPAAETCVTAELFPEGIDSLNLIRTSPVRTFEGQALYEHINGGAEVYHQYQFVEVATAYYRRDEVEVALDIFRFANSDMAYGLFTTLRPPQPALVPLGVEGLSSPTSVDFVKGFFVVRVTGYEESVASATTIDLLARAVNDTLPGTTEPPQVFSHFPADSRVPGTNKLHAEAYLGRSFLRNVYTRDYVIAGDTVTLFLSDDELGEKLAAWRSQADDSSTGSLPFTTENGICVPDSYYGTIMAAASGEFLAGVVSYEDRHLEVVRDWLETLARR